MRLEFEYTEATGICTVLQSSLVTLKVFAQQMKMNLLLVAVESAALLGVDELVPVSLVSVPDLS